MSQRKRLHRILSFRRQLQVLGVETCLPEHSVHKSSASRTGTAPSDVHRFVHRRGMRNPIQVQDLIKTDAQRGEQERLDPLQGPAGKNTQEIIQLGKMSKGAVYQLRREPKVPLVFEAGSKARQLLAGARTRVVQTVQDLTRQSSGVPPLAHPIPSLRQICLPR